jgi:peptidyl-prolyl cis-trans isomerase D
MALIGKIRSKSGIIVIIIGVALAAFVLGDFVRKRPKTSQNVGEIAGEKITYHDFETEVDAQIEMIKQQSGSENLTNDQMFQLRDEVWKKMERDFILGAEYEKLGVTVCSDELWDLVQGKEPHQYILQNFADPQTGQFNPSQVRLFLQNLEQYEQQKPGTKAQWENLEQSIKSDRIYNKYLNLIKGGLYLPTALAKKDYDQRNRKAVIRIFADKYSNIADNTVTISADDIQKYYDAHKQEYELSEASRDLDYIVYEVIPSADDIKKVNDEVASIMKDIVSTSDIDMPNFVNKNSDKPYDSIYYKKGALALDLDTIVFTKKKGDIIGPIYDPATYTYTISKIVNFQLRPDSLKASHILVAYTGAMRAPETVTRTKEIAGKMADSLLAVIKKDPKKFDEIAKTQNDDAAAKEKSGDLNWFADGAMIGAFNEACINGKEGEIKKVETPFGYHIIKITGKKKPENKIRLATITIKIEPSNETFQAFYAKASEFAGENKTIEQFNKSIVDKKLNKRTAEQITDMTNKITGLESAREIIRWAFEENTKKGDVSKVFDLQGFYVVAALKEIREKGIPTLDQVKTYIEPLVKREKKAETLIKKINALKTSGISIDALAQKVNATIDTLDFITFSSYSLPGFGPEPNVIGTLFTLKKGQLSAPIKGNSGVFVIYVDNFIEAPATNDFKTTRTQLLGTFKQRVTYDVYSALEKNAKISDNRKAFY